MDDEFGGIDDTSTDNIDFSSDSGDSFDDSGADFDDSSSDFNADDGLEFDDGSNEDFSDDMSDDVGDEIGDVDEENFDDSTDFDADEELEFDDGSNEEVSDEMGDDVGDEIEDVDGEYFDDSTDLGEDDGLEFDDTGEEFDDAGEEFSDENAEDFEDSTDEGFDEDTDNPEGWDTPIDDIDNMEGDDNNMDDSTNDLYDDNPTPKGYLDDDNKWHGSEDDEPLFGPDGELRDLNDEEIPLTADELNGENENINEDNNDAKGYLDEDNKWHGSEDDEPLFGEDGELRDLNDEEIPLTDDERDKYGVSDDSINPREWKTSVEETEKIDNEDLYKAEAADELPPDDPSKPKHDIPNETEIMTADPDNIHINDDSLLNNNNTDYTNDKIDGNNDFNKGRYDIVDSDKPITENDEGNLKDINTPDNNENMSDNPKSDTEQGKKGNIFDRLFKGKNKSNNEVPNSNNEIDDFAEKNEFTDGLKSKTQDRDKVLESDIEKIKNGTWDTNTHKPGGIARTPGDKGKIKDDEDDPII